MEVVTVYPGMQVDTSSLKEWVEWRADLWERIAGRQQQKPLFRLSLRLHLFSREEPSRLSMHEMVDAARPVYTQQTVPVLDYSENDKPLVGHVLMYESELQDLSRNDLEAGRHALKHSLLEWRGIVQEL